MTHSSAQPEQREKSKLTLQFARWSSKVRRADEATSIWRRAALLQA